MPRSNTNIAISKPEWCKYDTKDWYICIHDQTGKMPSDWTVTQLAA